MTIERRDFMGKAFMAGVGLATLMKGVVAFAKGLPSDPDAPEVAAGADEIALPKFDKNSAITLDQAMLERKSSRNYDENGTISREQLSRILWAADGLNREGHKRVTPSAVARYPVGVYVALPEGVYLYESKDHKLVRMIAQDIQEQIPLMPALKKARALLLYVVNTDKLLGLDPWMADLEVGCKVQNVYLEAASLGLGCCVFAMVHFDNISKALGLKNKQLLRIAQAVGPLKKE